jgi:hypothetical protein
LSSRAKVIAGTLAVALAAAGGAAFAAVELTSTSHTTTVPVVTTPFDDGVGSYGLGVGRLGGRGFGGGLGPGGSEEFGFRHFLGGGMTAAASYLGLSASQLYADLAGGRTLAQVAKSHGKTVDGTIAAMTTQVRKILAGAVSHGVLTQPQATQIASRLAVRMKQMANGARPDLGGPDGEPATGNAPGASGTGSFGANA